MTHRRVLERVQRYLLDLPPEAPEQTELFEDVPGLGLVRRTRTTAFEAALYEPIACLILQGRKETTIGDRRFEVGAGETIIVSHGLPVEARILEASPRRPYLSLVVRLDLTELRSLYDEIGDADAPEAIVPSAYAVGPTDEALIAVLERYVALYEEPDAARVLLPLVRRELHFRLLGTSHGAMLRRLLRRDSHASQISKAIEQLRAEFRDPLEVPRLARSVGMSASSFYKHFKNVTSTTPLQYHKDLRLMEARRLLLGGEHSVSTAAFEVGYESPTQFSREFARKFGAPPSASLRVHRAAV